MVTKSKTAPHEKKGFMFSVFSKFYTPFLMKTWTRVIVLILFLLGFCLSIAVIPKLPVGLEQELSMPEDSYVLKYFQVKLLLYNA
jgi:Niemann-Pick C1 protein